MPAREPKNEQEENAPEARGASLEGRTAEEGRNRPES